MEEAGPVRRRIPRPRRELRELADELLDDWVPADERERGRLDHRKRPNGRSVASGCKERDYAAVRMADEVRVRREELRDVVCVSVEVDASVRARASEPTPIDQQ